MATMEKFEVGGPDDDTIPPAPVVKETESQRSGLVQGSQKSKGYIFFVIPKEWVVLPEEGEEVEIKNSPRSTTFLLLNTMIGSGILVQAYVMSQAGIVSSILLYIVVGWLIFTGVEVLIRLAEKKQIFDYSELSVACLGEYGGYTIDTAIVINNFGALLSYVIIIGSLMDSIISTYDNCTVWACHPAFLTIFPIVLFVAPLCLIRRFGHLAMISYISIAVISATIMLVIFGGPVKASENGTSGIVNIGSFSGTVQNMGSIVFALGFSTAAFHAYVSMDPQSVKVFTNVSIYTTALGVVMCFTTAIFGYLSFRSATETNILENFGGSVGAVFKIALTIHLILYIPADFVIMRASLLKLFKMNSDTLSDVSFISLSLGLISLVTFIAIMLQMYDSGTALGEVVDITGGLAGSVAYFLVPGAAGVYAMADDPYVYKRSIALLLLGSVIVILVVIVSFVV